MKALVTGGAGFIGSHLCERLVSRGYEVQSLDNYSSGTTDNHVPGVEYTVGDSHDIAKLVGSPPDILFHLGEYSRVEHSFSSVDKVLRSNVRGTSEVVLYAKEHQIKLVYAGSSTKFADGGEGPKQSPYGWSKAANTELVQGFIDWFSLDAAIVYFYNAYGPREVRSGEYATVVARFSELMRRGKPLGVVSPGTQLRNFTHVSDIVDGLLLVGEKGQGGDYGIGSPEAYSIVSLAEMFGGDIEMLPAKMGNRMSGEVRSGKISGLGWKPAHTLPDYIAELRKKNFL